MLLMPLRFVLSLLSKTNDFLPCAERSWIYWTLAIAMILFRTWFGVLVLKSRWAIHVVWKDTAPVILNVR